MKSIRTPALSTVAVLLLSIAAPARADYSINFNNGTDAGLTHYDPLMPFGSGATFTFPNGGYRLTSNPSADLNALGPARVGSYQGSQSFGDFRLSVDVVTWNAQLDEGFGLAARLSNIGLGTSNGYFLHYNNNPGIGQPELFLERFDGEQTTPAFASVSLSALDPSVGFRMIFTGIGSTLTGQVFALNNLNTALATVSFVDSTYRSGFTGVLATGFAAGPNTSVDATFDNLTATSVPEPSSLAMMGLGLAGLAVVGLRPRLPRA